MKKKLVIALSLLVVVAIAVGGTLAYFSVVTPEVKNVFTVGKNVKVTLEDIFEPNSPVYPNADIKKEVGVRNTAAADGTPVYAAVTALFEYNEPDVYPDGKLKYGNIKTADEIAALSEDIADYTLITDEISPAYAGYYIKNTAIEFAYEKDGAPATAEQIAAEDYDTRKVTFDSGEPIYKTPATVADYSDASDSLWALIKLQHGDAAPFTDGINEPDWTYAGNTADGRAVFICTKVLNPGDYSACFTNVHVNDVEPVFPFSITVKGYAVQAAGFDSAAEAIADAFNLVVTP
ncbi:MAG: hypothetical protein IJR51_08545 [Clostridia bacterium]|nr:hypothetical protein [Clostridia bacterium]MBQ9507189.1 hypothetical protein [Clostridia bacterium]MBR5423199.1 hypothetical protein [Clostridia bacterium]